MKSVLFSLLFVVLAGCSNLRAQAEPTPLPTPNDIPALLAGPVKPAPPTATPTPPAENGGMCAMCQLHAEATPSSETDEAILAKLEQDWGDAIARHDAEFLDRIEADDYTYTGPDGVVSHKPDEIAGAKANYVRIDSFKHRNVKVRVYVETAVVTGATTLKGAAGDMDLSGDFRWTDVFVKHNGQWRVVASQATAITRSEPEN